MHQEKGFKDFGEIMAISKKEKTGRATYLSLSLIK
jgi:hypothetical protein